MTTIHAIRKSIVIGLAVLGIGGAAIAADSDAGRHGHAASKEQRQAKWQEHAAKRQARLQEALKLTPAQAPAWSAYQAAVKRPAAGARAERSSQAALPAPQRLEQHIGMAKERLAAMEARLAALNTLYATLTPEQKKVFDEKAMRGGHRMRHQHHAMHG